MTSPICTVNTLQTDNGIDVAGNTTVTIQLADLAGVYAWSIQCISTDEGNNKDTINTGLSINNITKTATFTSPSVPDGSALIFESKVNNGKDSNFRTDATLVTRFEVHVLTGSGNRLVAFDEKMECSAVYGWTKKINDLIRTTIAGLPGFAGLGLYYSGGTYNVGAANDSITINADSIELKAAYKTLLDGKATIATPNTLAYRGASAECTFAALTSTTLTASGQISTTIASPSGISAANGDITAFRFAVTNLGSNILIARKNISLGSTVDIQALNGFALKVYTDGGTLTIATPDTTGATNSAATFRTTGANSGTGNTGGITDTIGNAAGASAVAGSYTGTGGNGFVGTFWKWNGGNSIGGMTRGGSFSWIPGTGGLVKGNYYFGSDPVGLSGDSTNGGGVIVLKAATQIPTSAPTAGHMLLWFDSVSNRMYVWKAGIAAAQAVI